MLGLENAYNLAVKATKAVPKFVKKHPVAAATGLGMGTFGGLGSRAAKTEGDIMAEYAGGVGSKYAGDTFNQFSKRKDLGSIKTATLIKQAATNLDSQTLLPSVQDQIKNERLRQKIAYGPNDTPDYGRSFNEGLINASGKGLVNEAIGAIRRLLGFSAQKAVDKLQKDPTRAKIVDAVISGDPYISEFERQNPGQTSQAFQTMRQVAPTLSTDPNIVRSYLRNTAMTGGAIDYTTVKSLADAEAAVHRAKNEGAWGRGGF